MIANGTSASGGQNATASWDDDDGGGVLGSSDRANLSQRSDRLTSYQIGYSIATALLFLMMVVPLLRCTWRGWFGHFVKRKWREASAALRRGRGGRFLDIAPTPAESIESDAESIDARAARVAAAALRSQSVRRKDVPLADLPPHAREQGDCAVCLGPLDAETAVVLHCGHSFDPQCLQSSPASDPDDESRGCFCPNRAPKIERPSSVGPGSRAASRTTSASSSRR